MGIAVEPGLRFRNADLAQKLENARTRVLPGQTLVEKQSFADLLLDMGSNDTAADFVRHV